MDNDGYPGADGDRNDCDPNTNPGAFDVPGNVIDDVLRTARGGAMGA